MCHVLCVCGYGCKRLPSVTCKQLADENVSVVSMGRIKRGIADRDSEEIRHVKGKRNKMNVKQK